jgi:transketolase C-terminal domain/subunit
MPATTVQSARYAANIYAALVISERRLLAMLSARPCDRAEIEEAIAETRDVARDAYGRYRRRVLDLFESGQFDPGIRIVLDVQERTRAARTPDEITISED